MMLAPSSTIRTKLLVAFAALTTIIVVITATSNAELRTKVAKLEQRESVLYQEMVNLRHELGHLLIENPELAHVVRAGSASGQRVRFRIFLPEGRSYAQVIALGAFPRSKFPGSDWRLGDPIGEFAENPLRQTVSGPIEPGEYLFDVEIDQRRGPTRTLRQLDIWGKAYATLPMNAIVGVVDWEYWEIISGWGADGRKTNGNVQIYDPSEVIPILAWQPYQPRIIGEEKQVSNENDGVIVWFEPWNAAKHESLSEGHGFVPESSRSSIKSN